MSITEDEVKARVRQTAHFLSQPGEKRDSPLQRHIEEILVQAVREFGPERVKGLMEELKSEVGPARLARIMEAFETATKRY